MTGERTYLTERQLEILSLRRDGHSRSQISEKLGISRQNVAVLEKRAIRNIERAAATIELAGSRGIVRRITLNRGLHILDAAKIILSKADGFGIRLTDNVVTVLSAIRSASGDSVKAGILEKELSAYVLQDGRLLFR